MSSAKRQLEKREAIYHYAFTFLVESDYIEESRMDGTIYTKYYSDNPEIFIKSNKFYNNLKNVDFSLKEFRDEIKKILDTAIYGVAFENDLKKLG